MARRRQGRGLLRTLVRHWLEGLVIVGMNTWTVSEMPAEDITDALFGGTLTPWEREEFERLAQRARS
ncbi:hypothetical protein GCM10010191_21220 [Actinomadura vinacea]|uniref:Uncharacterized protein n=1 Tax=Actinomadura vinacea TaxID=115336 RepID=A0ABN3IQN0_9ACTN